MSTGLSYQLDKSHNSFQNVVALNNDWEPTVWYQNIKRHWKFYRIDRLKCNVSSYHNFHHCRVEGGRKWKQKTACSIQSTSKFYFLQWGGQPNPKLPWHHWVQWCSNGCLCILQGQNSYWSLFRVREHWFPYPMQNSADPDGSLKLRQLEENWGDPCQVPQLRRGDGIQWQLLMSSLFLPRSNPSSRPFSLHLVLPLPNLLHLAPALRSLPNI